MDTPLTPEQLERIREAALAGNKIQAIKLYREATNLGLAESKQAVEDLEAHWRAGEVKSGTPAPGTPAPKAPPRRGTTGCLVLLAFPVMGLIAALYAACSRHFAG